MREISVKEATTIRKTMAAAISKTIEASVPTRQGGNKIGTLTMKGGDFKN